MITNKTSRLKREIEMLLSEPPPGICVWVVEENTSQLQAEIQGPPDTPYEKGIFLLDLQIPSRYPFEPPKVRFVTPIYHPNIDSGGRICLDTLKMQPNGSWTPSINLSTLLTTIRVLMGQPNPDDGLMPDITDLYRKDQRNFELLAKEHTQKHATAKSINGTCSTSQPAYETLECAPVDKNLAERMQPSKSGTSLKRTISTEEYSSSESDSSDSESGTSSHSEDSAPVTKARKLNCDNEAI